MMMMKMKRLSIDSEYSVSQPAKNSVPYWAAGEVVDAEPEQDGRADVDRQRDGDLAGRRLVRPSADDHDVEEQHAHA